MKEQKIKTYNIILSRVFPKTHPRAGQPTGFNDKVMANFRYPSYDPTLLEHKKLHTIRANYEYWKQIFEEVERGYAVINLRQWLGEPYRSKTVIIKTLTAADGIGIQKVKINTHHVCLKNEPERLFSEVGIVDDVYEAVLVPSERLAKNDGLELQDWLDWFRDYDNTQPLAIIHFTPFRYTRKH